MSDVPCENYVPEVGCHVWCMKGDMDCCVLCCRRNVCDDVCPTAKRLLKKSEWKDKHYEWDPTTTTTITTTTTTSTTSTTTYSTIPPVTLLNYEEKTKEERKKYLRKE